jgi:hypothetical protein
MKGRLSVSKVMVALVERQHMVSREAMAGQL